MKQYIRLEPLEYIPRKPQPIRATEEERIRNIINLAQHLNIKIQNNTKSSK